MNISQIQIEALRIFGYTEVEARFLYLVATHSGYFVGRQFLGFAGTSWNKRTSSFWNKLQANRHARTYRFAQGGTVYHLFARRIYDQIGHQNLRNSREHEFEYIHTQVAMLDFVLGNLDLHYFETESDKVDYFSKELGVDAHQLPSKTYGGVKPTVRHFADRFPMFLPTRPGEPPIITFTYLQGAEANLVRFVRHLRTYLPLFRQLSAFRFLFLARSEGHFLKACELFRDLVTIPLESNPAEDLLRYFAVRKEWDLGNYASVTEGDLIFRNLAKERFRGTRFEHMYRAWKAGRVAEAEIRDDLRGSDKPHCARFDTQVLKAIRGEAVKKSNHTLNTCSAAGGKPAEHQPESLPAVPAASSEVQIQGGNHADRKESTSRSQPGDTDGGTSQRASR